MTLRQDRDYAQLCAHLTALAFMAFVVFSLTTWQRLPAVLNQVIDDAFYYSVPAYNISRGAGSTFDGIHLTNGYHPLWLLMQIPVFYAIPEMGESTFRIILGIQVALAVISTLLLYLLVWLQLKAGLLAVGTAGIWIVLQRGVLITGLETPLYAVALVSILIVWFVYFSDSRGGKREETRHYVFLGVLCGLAAMARLDAAILGSVIGLVLFWRWCASDGSVRFRELVGFALPFAVIMLTYFAVNLAVFGLATPISGHVKLIGRAFRRGYTEPNVIGYIRLLFWAFHKPAQNVLVIAGLFIYPVWLGATWIIAWTTRIRRFLEQALVWLPFCGFAWLLTIYYVVGFYDPLRSTAGWYYLPARIMGLVTIALMLAALYHITHSSTRDGISELKGHMIVLLCAALLSWKFQLSPLRIGATVVMILLSGCIGSVIRTRFRPYTLLLFAVVVIVVVPVLTIVRSMSRFRPTNHTAYYDAALWIRRNTASDAIIAAYNAGSMGFFSGRRVINLDGYANSKSFPEEMRRLGILRYLVKNNVEYVVDCFPMVDPYQNVQPCNDSRIRRIWVSPKNYGSCELQVYRVSTKSGAARSTCTKAELDQIGPMLQSAGIPRDSRDLRSHTRPAPISAAGLHEGAPGS